MGAGLIKFYRTKIKREWKIAFAAAFFIGLLTHIYKFTNTLPNHDSLYNFYSDQNMIGSGRWFLSIACGFSSYYDLPWVNGLLSIIFIALTAAVVVDIFKIKDRIMILLTGGLLAAFPAITATFAFEFTADGYMIAMFMASLAVRLSLIGDRKKSHIILSSVLICLSCGIYQAYVSFALVLAICYFICEILENKHSNKELLVWIGKQATIYITALAAYYIIWQVCMKAFGYTATSYMGIDSVNSVFNFHTIIRNVYFVIAEFVIYFFNLENGISLHFILSIFFLISTLLGGITAMIKSKILKNKFQTALMALATLAIPFAVHIWQMAATESIYVTRMQQSICILYIFVGVLFCRWSKPKFANIVAVLLTAVIALNFVNANIFYYKLNENYERAYAEMTEMSSRIHMLDDGNVKCIAVIGEQEAVLDRSEQPYCGKIINFMCGKRCIIRFLDGVVDFELSYYKENPSEEIPIVERENMDPTSNQAMLRFPIVNEITEKQLEKSHEVAEMGCWPASDSVKRIGGTIVIKLSEPVEDEQ